MFGEGVLVVAHRGASARAGRGNVLEAYELAIAMGAPMAELDVRRLADGTLVCHHDATVDGVPLATMDRAAMDRATASHGYRAPTLDEVAALARGRIQLDVEVKQAGFEAELLAVLQRHLTRDAFIAKSFFDPVVATLKTLEPRVRAGLLVGVGQPIETVRTRLSEFYPEQRILACHADFVSPYRGLVRLGFVRRMRRLGVPVVVWTVNDRAEMRRLVDLGVDALVTDHPDRAMDLLRRMGR